MHCQKPSWQKAVNWLSRASVSSGVRSSTDSFESIKLNIDKALLALRWEPNLSYAECMEMTGVWYRDVQKHGASAAELTRAQIAEYENIAAARLRVWAQ